MLENWVWNKESLKLLSAHYKDSSSIDDNLLNDLIKTKNTGSGMHNMRQIMFAKMDQYFHTNEKAKIYI
jgi:Zn-dependent oligopeptidase